MEPDQILQDILRQARQLGIPVSDRVAPHIVLNKRAKKRYGRCMLQNGVYTIEISAFIPPEDLLVLHETIAHEVLHTCPGCMNHGPLWKSYAAQMAARYGYRIERTAKEPLVREDPPEARYLLECTACGMQYPRQKMSRSVRYAACYRCRCGGRLRRLR